MTQAAHLGWYRGRTVLVTGGAGAIGGNLVRALSEAGAELVVVLDDLSAGVRWNVPDAPNVAFVRGSVTDEAALKRVFAQKPSIVFHLAAFFANQNSVEHPQKDLQTNGLGSLLVLQYAQLSGVERVVYTSSGCSIYGSNAPLPLQEDFTSLHLTTPYQITKMLGELYCNFFQHHHGIETVKVRLFNSFGPGEVPGQYRNVIPNFIYWALLGRAIPITGTGEETRDFTFVGDVVDALLRAGWSKAAIGQEINVAAGREVRILDLATAVNRLCGNAAGIQFIERRHWDTKSRVLASIERAHTVLGYTPSTEFEAGLDRTVRWFRGHWPAIQAAAEFPPETGAAGAR